jgi:hypothetical protein
MKSVGEVPPGPLKGNYYKFAHTSGKSKVNEHEVKDAYG